MEPENDQKKLAHQIEALRSGNRTAILASLKELRMEGEVAVLPELFDLLLDQEDEQILLDTRNILNDLKDPSAAAILAGAINKKEFEEIRSVLVAACWQNGLSYGEYLEEFVDAALHGDYMTAIEAFTVIEGAIGEVEPLRREKAMETIRSQISGVDEQKKILLDELVKVIASY
ncbi:MAG: hypothetical protein ACWGNV_13990 [Bacteroidales bacterium]